MSIVAIRTALETRLNNMASPISYAWENLPFTPVSGVPYAQIYLLPADPDNPTMGDGFHRERGVFQISLFYPLQAGAGVAEARAELIKTAFARGQSMTSGAVTVRINKTPTIGHGRVDGDRWHVPVKIQYFADIF
jgi:hypothetical protein